MSEAGQFRKEEVVFTGIEPSDMYSGPENQFGAPTAKYRLVRNAAKCKSCSDIIESWTRWSFVTCSCGNVSVDGGLDYARRVFKDGNYEDHIEDLSEYVEIDDAAG